MASLVQCLLASAVLLSVFSLAIGEEKKKKVQKCYQCNSVDDPGCMDTPTPEKYLKPCNESGTHPRLGDIKELNKTHKTSGMKPYEYHICRKLIQTAPKYDIAGQGCPVGAMHRIIRMCGIHEDKDRLGRCFYRGGLGTSATYCSCGGNGCNGSRSLSANLSFVILSSLLYFPFLLF